LNVLAIILSTIGSLASIGFGVWHFFVPRAWKWYAYIDPKATELVAAVRAINIFFSLSLVLFGGVLLVFVWGGFSDPVSIVVILAANSILWLIRVVLQIVYPQGSINPVLQYGMLSAFVIVALCFLVALATSLCVFWAG